MDEPAIIERLQTVRGELAEIKTANQVYWRSNVHSEPETDLYERRRKGEDTTHAKEILERTGAQDISSIGISLGLATGRTYRPSGAPGI
jgi:hypothetical protein